MNISIAEQRIQWLVSSINRTFPLIVLVLATSGNTLCFLVFCRAKFQKRLTRTSSICLRLLCTNDLILVYLFIIDVLLRHYGNPSKRIYGSVGSCRVYKLIRYTLLDMSAYLQLGLTTDRFICCVHRSYYSQWRKRLYLYYLLVMALLVILFKNSSFLSPLYGYSITSKDRTQIRCSASLKAEWFAKYMAYGQSLIDVVFVTCVPFFLILYFNSRILREVIRSRHGFYRTWTRLIHLEPVQQQTNVRHTTVILTQHRSRHRRLHLTFALGCISFVFILSTGPYKIFKVVERRDKLIRDHYKGLASKSVNILLAEVIIECLEYVSCATPFFVCFLTSSMFREELHKMFTRQNIRSH